MSWIDFRKLRESLSFRQVLDAYGVELRTRDDKASGFCPLPSHKGDKQSPSFSVQLSKGIFQCFGCRAKGNVLDFACLMEGKDPRNGADVREVAIALNERFGGDRQPGGKPRREPVRQHRSLLEPKPEPAAPVLAKPSVPIIVNAPLDFELKELDPNHPYLRERGFRDETIRHFALGFCNRGTFKGRIVIPLHDARGQFIGYAGRITSDKLISPNCPKYKFPAPREHEGQIHELHKSLFLYNGHRIVDPVTDLVVVEGFASVWWLWQHGYPAVVSIMGSSCSADQAAQIVELVEPDGRVWVLGDGDEGGKHCNQSVAPLVASHRFVRCIDLPEGKQPTDCPVHDLSAMLPFGTAKKTRPAKPRSTSVVKPSQSTNAQ